VSATPAGLSLSAEEDQAFRRGVAQFNRGEYFECHDTLEEVWAGVRGSGRDFLQGLIQVSVAFYHLGNANPAGARSMFGRALARWRPYPDRYFGFDLAAQRRAVEEAIGRLEAGEEAKGPLPWTFDPA
jgi:predicted metal-dependent hydrolase